jgi:hypothetical protein
MTIETLKNLPLMEAQTQPLSDAVKNFYLDTFAGGSGPDGTYLITDFFGTAAGVPGTESLVTTIRILNARLADGTLSSLAQIYLVMKNVVSGTYGNPVTGPVIIPSGLPGAGTYNGIPPTPGPDPEDPGDPGVTPAEQAFQVLVPLAQAAIAAAASAMGTDTTSLNNAFVGMATHVTQEPVNQVKAAINFADLTAGDQTSVMALTTSFTGLGTDVAVGQASQFFENIVDINTATGQAIIGAMREGRNQVQLAEVGINGYDIVPDQPETPPPGAPLLGSSYTVAEAESRVSRDQERLTRPN